MLIPSPAPPRTFDGGCAFADGADVPQSDAKISLFDWGFDTGRLFPTERQHG